VLGRTIAISGLRRGGSSHARRHRGEHRRFSQHPGAVKARARLTASSGVVATTGHPTLRRVDRRRDRRDRLISSRRDLVTVSVAGRFAQHAELFRWCHAGVRRGLATPCGPKRYSRWEASAPSGRAAADGPRRRPRQARDGARVLSRAGRLSLGHRAFSEPETRHRRDLWTGGSGPTSGASSSCSGARACA